MINTSILAEVDNATSKRGGVTSSRFYHVLGTIAIQRNNVSYDSRAIPVTIGSDNDFHKPRAITIKSDNFSPVLKP